MNIPQIIADSESVTASHYIFKSVLSIGITKGIRGIGYAIAIGNRYGADVGIALPIAHSLQ